MKTLDWLIPETAESYRTDCVFGISWTWPNTATLLLHHSQFEWVPFIYPLLNPSHQILKLIPLRTYGDRYVQDGFG